MTSISSLNSINNLAGSPSPTTNGTASTEDRAATQSATAPQPSTIVTLGQANQNPLQIYSISGASNNSAPNVTWANPTGDAVSKLMAQTYQDQDLGNRLDGLGSALLDQLGSTGTNFSQSVQVSAANSLDSIGSTASESHAEINLTIKMASGAEVDITLDSEGNELSVSAHSSSQLSAADRSALTSLSGAFQAAINGLSASSPSLDLSGLTQYDSSVISSVTLHSSVTNSARQTQTIDLSANSSAKTVSVSGPTGTIKVSVDAGNALIEGNQQQRNAAIDEYLQQFDQENARGHGDTSLMNMFKDAFAQMNGADNDSSQAGPDALYSQSVTGAKGAVLTGLDDFSASITDTAVSSNPMLPDETDTFSYQVSQQTTVEGNSLNGDISQEQQSHLSATYHMALSADAPLLLTKDLGSQNYKYVRIDDSADSTTHLGFQKGVVTQASLKQSASQSTETQSYLRGKLISDTTVPAQSSKTSDLMALLKPIEKDNPEPQNTPQWKQALSEIHSEIFLQADPANLQSST